MKTSEMTPAVAHLITSAAESSALEFAFELETFDGKYAADIIQEALENLNPLTPKANVGLLRRRLADLNREAKR